MNWVAAGWFTDKKGFLLNDALISVFIVSVLAVVTSAALTTHYHAAEIIREETGIQEEKDEKKLSEIKVCEICTESPVPSETPVASY